MPTSSTSSTPNHAVANVTSGFNLTRDDRPGFRCIQPETKPVKPSQVDFQELREFFSKGYRQITGQDIAWPFLEPVNEQLAEVPNYYDVIKQPMDFSTLRKRYRNHWYSSLDHFLSDYRLIFSNCYRFNDPSTDIHAMARELEQFSMPHISVIEKASSEMKKLGDTNSNLQSEKSIDKNVNNEIKSTKSDLKKRNSENSTQDVSTKKSSTNRQSLKLPKTLIDSSVVSPSTTESANINNNKRETSTIGSPKKKPTKNAKMDGLSLVKSTPETNETPEMAIVAPSIDPVIESIKNDLENNSNNLKQIFFDPHVTQSYRPGSSFSTQIMTDCIAILTDLKQEKHNHVIWPFINHPPNAKFPDLNFVETSLINGKYNSVEEFATAIRHVFMHILTTFDQGSQIVTMASQSLDIFHNIYSLYLNKNLSLINNRTKMLSSVNQKIEDVYKLLMEDCEIQKNLGMNDRKLLQIDKRYSELERQFNIYKSQSTQTIDKLRKRISYLKSKQQSDLVYINEKFQTAVKSAAQIAGSGSFNGQSLPQSAPLQSKNVKNKLNKYYQSKNIAPLKEMDKLEQTSRSIMLAGISKSDDEEESERILTHDERRKLSYDIDRLSQKMLTQLIDQITIWENLDPTKHSEFVIDYDNMKPNTLRKVTQFVSSCIKRLPRQKQIQGIPVTDPSHPNYSSTIINLDKSESNLNVTETKQTDQLSESSEGEQLQIEESELKNENQPNNLLTNSTTKKNFINLKKSLDSNQLVSALHLLEKDKSENTSESKPLTNQKNAFVHLIPGNHSLPLNSPNSNLESITPAPNTSAWSNFAENLKENINSAGDAKALESVVGENYNFQASRDKKTENESPVDNSQNLNTSPINEPIGGSNSLNQAISSPASSSSGANKEQLKAEAKKKRAANIDKNATIEQRELISSYEEGAMMQ